MPIRASISGQASLFDGTRPLRIEKPIRLIELFAGIGAQAKALSKLGLDFEHYRICEFDKYAVQAYNSIHGTDFQTSDITEITAKDLGITDTDRYTYILTYSFPCTDLSNAGARAGMGRDSGTRSGLLWEVERLLKEMDELPQILLMENVPEVVSDKNIKDFAEWLSFLDSLGYKSKYEILNAKDFGVPQNRARCFMLSWQGDFYYDFPTSRLPDFPTSRLIDVLESHVDERFFLSKKAVAKLQINEDIYSHFINVERERERAIPVQMSRHGIERVSDTASTLMARDYKGFGNQTMTGIVVAGSLNPDKEVQDRVRVLSPQGICQGLRATDYKDPPKVLLQADGIYTNDSPAFFRGPLSNTSRTIKAITHDAGCVLVYGHKER